MISTTQCCVTTIDPAEAVKTLATILQTHIKWTDPLSEKIHDWGIGALQININEEAQKHVELLFGILANPLGNGLFQDPVWDGALVLERADLTKLNPQASTVCAHTFAKQMIDWLGTVQIAPTNAVVLSSNQELASLQSMPLQDQRATYQVIRMTTKQRREKETLTQSLTFWTERITALQNELEAAEAENAEINQKRFAEEEQFLKEQLEKLKSDFDQSLQQEVNKHKQNLDAHRQALVQVENSSQSRIAQLQSQLSTAVQYANGANSQQAILAQRATNAENALKELQWREQCAMQQLHSVQQDLTRARSKLCSIM